MYSILLKHFLYPMGEKLIGTRMIKYLDEVDETQWCSPKELQEIQNRKLRLLIKHAYEKVPYYRKIFAERDLTDKDIQTVNDLYKLPILTKDDIRQNYQDMLAKDFEKWKPFRVTTGGSTGEPLKYYVTLDTASVNWACMFRGWGWAGYKLGDKKVTLGGSSLVPDKRPNFRDRIRWLVERTLPIPTLNMSEEKLSLFCHKIQTYKPRFLYGYASALYLLADYLKEYKINDIHPQAVFTTAEMLLPHYREEIENIFECEVFDCYGCYDGGPQAFECSTHQGYHISSEKAIMEFIDDNGKPVSPGCPGEIIATDLHNYAMPFIRYAVGDVGTPSKKPCTCGRGLPLIESIEGRTLDFIILPNGDKVRGLRLIDLFYEHIQGDYIKELATIKQFQIIQNNLEELLVLIVQDAEPSVEEIQYLKSELLKAINYPMKIKIEFVKTITHTKGGKRRLVSNVC